MTQLAQLSEDEIEDRLYVVGQRPVQFLLTGFADHADPFTVQFAHNANHFLTVLLAVSDDNGKLIFDCSGSPETNRQFLESDHNVFVGRPGGIHVQFTTGPAVEVFHEGARAFAVPLPKKVLRLQRREAFRIDIPRNRAPQCFLRLPSGALFNAQPINISCGGLGLLATHLPDEVTTELVLRNCRLALPEDSNDIYTDAIVRHLTEIEARAGLRQWRIGLEFRNLDHAAENRIQRYIARVEHERRELA